MAYTLEEIDAMEDKFDEIVPVTKNWFAAQRQKLASVAQDDPPPSGRVPTPPPRRAGGTIYEPQDQDIAGDAAMFPDIGRLGPHSEIADHRPPKRPAAVAIPAGFDSAFPDAGRIRQV
jgi:hypothetical protein